MVLHGALAKIKICNNQSNHNRVPASGDTPGWPTSIDGVASNSVVVEEISSRGCRGLRGTIGDRDKKVRIEKNRVRCEGCWVPGER